MSAKKCMSTKNFFYLLRFSVSGEKNFGPENAPVTMATKRASLKVETFNLKFVIRMSN